MVAVVLGYLIYDIETDLSFLSGHHWELIVYCFVRGWISILLACADKFLVASNPGFNDLLRKRRHAIDSIIKMLEKFRLALVPN